METGRLVRSLSSPREGVTLLDLGQAGFRLAPRLLLRPSGALVSCLGAAIKPAISSVSYPSVVGRPNFFCRVEGWREVAGRTRPDPQALCFSEEIKQGEPAAFTVSLSLPRVLRRRKERPVQFMPRPSLIWRPTPLFAAPFFVPDSY